MAKEKGQDGRRIVAAGISGPRLGLSGDEIGEDPIAVARTVVEDRQT